MLILEIVFFGVVLGLFVIMVAVFLFKAGLIEVDPYEAVVVKNIWTGVPRALAAGTHQVIPGWEEQLARVTLKNEPSDPPAVNVITRDAVEIGVDYIVHTQQVADAVKVATVINYEQRNTLIQTRIRGYIQAEMKKYSAEEDLIEIIQVTQAQDGPKEKRRPNMAIASNIQDAVNVILDNEVLAQWGVKMEIRIQNLILPEKLTEVAEEAATAEREGQRIKDKAQAAGVPSWLMTLGDIAADVTRTLKGGGK